MSKLVVLELDGDFEQQGFRATLEIGLDSHHALNHYPLRQSLKIKGYLPANPELATSLQHHWQEKYRSFGTDSPRIKIKQVIHKGSINQRIKECIESAKQLQYNLNSWLKSESFREIDRRLREELNPLETIRFLIRTEDGHLKKLPWHLWDFFERYPKAEVALSPLESTSTHAKPITSLKSRVKILVILGHQEGIDIDADLRILKNLSGVELVVLVEPQHEEINDKLWEQFWDIIFFAGHSTSESETGRIYINPTDSITIHQLWYGLKKAVERGLKLAIFNSCDGLGLAKQLDDLQIPQMIVMRELVPDRVAQEFLKYFLKAFTAGEPLYLAVRQARQRLHDNLEREFPCASWLPIICQHPAAFPPTWQQLRKHDIGQWRILSIASVAIASFITAIRLLGLLQTLELKIFDQMMALRPNESPDPRLLIVTVTEKDVQNQNPQERRGVSISDPELLKLLEKLQHYQPKVIGLDIYRDFSPDLKHKKLETQLAENQRLIAVCEVGEAGKQLGVRPPAKVPIDRLSFSDFTIDPDNVIRRQLFGMAVDPQSFCSTDTSFSFRVAQAYFADLGMEFKRTKDDNLQLGNVVFQKLEPNTGGYNQIDARGYQVMLNYRTSGSVAHTLTLTDINSGAMDAELPHLVKNRIVLIGTTAPSFKDYFSTPYSTGQWSQKMPGLLIHAQMVSQIVSAVLDQRPLLWWWQTWAEIVWIWVWSFVGGTITWYLHPSKHLGLAIVAELGILYGLCFIFLLKSGWIPFVPSALAVVLTSASLVAYRQKSSQEQ